MPTPHRPHIVLVVTLIATSTHGAEDPIVIDGLFPEWTDRPVSATDRSGDGTDVDLVGLRVADTPYRLHLLVDFAFETDLSENNALEILIDTDDDPSTGLQREGIGAEIRFAFGEREGCFYPDRTSSPEDGVQIWHSDLSFQAAPTVTSDRFEIAFDRDAVVDGDVVFGTSPVSIVLIEEDGDRIPDVGAVVHTFDLAAPPPIRDVSISRERADDVRLMSWNVLRDSPWSSDEAEKYERIVQAIDPDVVHLQEIYEHSTTETRLLFGAWLGDADDWYAAGNYDCKTLSRYPILHSEALSGNLVVLLDTVDELGTTLLAINAHTPCCGNDDGRQWEIDEMNWFLGRVRSGRHPDVPADTAVQIVGDLNLVGFRQQLDSLVTGDIVYEGDWGGDIDPDVDGSDLLDTRPIHTEDRLSYTWRNDWSSFWPGRLDVSIISDAVLEPGRQLVVETRSMGSDRLAEYGLQAEDSSGSDHLAMITDVRPISPGVPGDLDGDGRVNGSDLGLLLSVWNQKSKDYDLTGDGIVTGKDIGAMLASWTG